MVFLTRMPSFPQIFHHFHHHLRCFRLIRQHCGSGDEKFLQSNKRQASMPKNNLRTCIQVKLIRCILRLYMLQIRNFGEPLTFKQETNNRTSYRFVSGFNRKIVGQNFNMQSKTKCRYRLWIRLAPCWNGTVLTHETCWNCVGSRWRSRQRGADGLNRGWGARKEGQWMGSCRKNEG